MGRWQSAHDSKLPTAAESCNANEGPLACLQVGFNVILLGKFFTLAVIQVKVLMVQDTV